MLGQAGDAGAPQRPVNGKDCKDLAVRAEEKGFRSRWVTP